jgi:cytochrome c biogenesis protein CcdA
MNTITSRLLESLIGLGYFSLGVAVCIGLMKYVGSQFLTKAGTAYLIAFPVFGIVGGWIEWVITGNNKAPICFNLSQYSFGIAVVLYTLAFFSHLMFSEEVVNKRMKAK